MFNKGLLLGWDTISPKGSLALAQENEVLICLEIFLSQSPIAYLFKVLKDMFNTVGASFEDLVGIALVRGPGSFTGIRTSVAVAKGLALALSIPIVAFSSLEVMAMSIPLEGKLLCPLINARRGELYGALFRWKDKKLERLTSDMVMEIEKWTALQNRVLFLGEIIKELKVDGISFLPPRAKIIALSAFERIEKKEIHDPKDLRPLYIRVSDAEATRGITVMRCE